jgi:glycerate dehydrogenase
LICIAATGTNNVDLTAARELNITVCNVPAYATASVVQHVFALLLSLTTHVHDYRRAVAQHHWERSKNFCFLDFPIHELAGKIFGIIGYGELGKAVATIAEAFGMTVLIAARPGSKAESGRLPLQELLPQVDVLSLHVPLTEQTRNLIGTRELGLMKNTAILINTARGGIVDESALAEALRSHRLGGAGVDVLTKEPPTDGNPLLVADIPNLIITPHTAWASVEARQRLIQQVSANIQAFLAGKPINQIG